jgi:hypothetical protein
MDGHPELKSQQVAAEEKNASFDRLMTHYYSPSVYMSARNISLIVYGDIASASLSLI